MRKNKKQSRIDYEWGWSFSYLTPWIFFMEIEEAEWMNTGFKWVLRIQCLGFYFEWVKEFILGHDRPISTSQGFNFRENALRSKRS